MVRLQNCSGAAFPGKGPTNHSGCNYGKGGGSDCYGDNGWVRDHIRFLPFPKGYSGATPPAALPRLDPSRITLSPAPGDPSEKEMSRLGLSVSVTVTPAAAAAGSSSSAAAAIIVLCPTVPRRIRTV